MTISTLLKFLVGEREAILTVARTPQAIWIGLLFVLAAGFAREYDGEDLLHEPWHLLIPLGASILSSAILYLLIRAIAWFRGATGPPFISGYRSFLALYWMTAPLALLYAIPFERFASAADAMRANLFLLALVAAWRVLLVARVISVLYNCTFIGAFFPVMLFADSLVLFILSFVPLPLISIMGGIRLSESEIVLQSTTLFITAVGIFSWLVWFFGTIGVALWRESPWQYVITSPQDTRVSRPLWAFAGASLAVWLLVVPFTQPEQVLRRHVETDLKANRIREALEIMSAHQPSDFPPHWDPPPRLGYRIPRPDIADIQEIAGTLSLAPWVKTIFNQKFVNSLRGHSVLGIWDELSPEEISRRIELLDRIPKTASVVSDVERGLSFLEDRRDLSDATRSSVKSWLTELRSGLNAAQQNGEAKSASPQ